MLSTKKAATIILVIAIVVSSLFTVAYANSTNDTESFLNNSIEYLA